MKYVVTQNGRVIDRGFSSYQHAWNWVNEYVKGLESNKAGSHIYTADFNVKEDVEDSERANKLYREMRTGRSIVRP